MEGGKASKRNFVQEERQQLGPIDFSDLCHSQGGNAIAAIDSTTAMRTNATDHNGRGSFESERRAYIIRYSVNVPLLVAQQKEFRARSFV